MGLQYGVLRGRPDRAKRADGVRSPRLQIRTMDASGQPWRVAVNMKSGDGSEGIFWIVDPLVGQPVLGSLAANSSASLNSVGTSRPTASQTAQPFPASRRLAMNENDPPTVILNTALRAQRGETCRKRRSIVRTSRHGFPVRGNEST